MKINYFKKLLWIIVLVLLLSGNTYSLDDPNHSYLRFSNAGSNYKYVEIDFKKKSLFDRHGQIYEIISEDKLYVLAKRRDVLFTINRYSGILFAKGCEINVNEGDCQTVRKLF